jgi:hypothetical protein
MKKYFIFILPVLLFTISCTEDVDIELNDDHSSRLVVDGSFTTIAKEHQIVLTRTTSYFDQEDAPRVTGAHVTITDGSIVFPLTEREPGVYKTDSSAQGEIGKEYTLGIELEDGEKYSATSPITKVAAIDSVGMFPIVDYRSAYLDPEDIYLGLYLFAQEPAGIGDNYLLSIYMNDTLLNDTVREFSFQNDDFIDGQYLPGVEFYWLNGNEFNQDSVRIRVDMLSIQEEYFDYIIALMLETDYRGSMFDGPPANIPTNIDNGGLGFFHASAVSSYEIDAKLSEYKMLKAYLESLR